MFIQIYDFQTAYKQGHFHPLLREGRLVTIYVSEAKKLKDLSLKHPVGVTSGEL